MRKLFKQDQDLLEPAMSRQFVSCSSLTGNPDEPFVIFHQQLGRFRTDWHAHTYGELVYAEHGHIHINSEERNILVPGWYAVWIPSGVRHEMWSDSPHLQMRAICFPSRALVAGTDQLAVFPVSMLLREMIRHTGQWHLSGRDRREAHTFLQAIQDILPIEATRKVSAFLPSTSNERLEPVLRQIRACLHEKISMQKLAPDFGFSVRSLTRLFTQQLGISFSAYCKIARMMRALEMIEERSYNVSDLAHAVGYESLSAFSNGFLEVCGMRPLDYMKERLLKGGAC